MRFRVSGGSVRPVAAAEYPAGAPGADSLQPQENEENHGQREEKHDGGRGFEAFVLEVLAEFRVGGLCWSRQVGKKVRFPDAPASPEVLGFTAQHSRRFHWSGWRRKNTGGYAAFKDELVLLLATLGDNPAGIIYGTEVDWDSSQDTFDDETTKIFGWGFIEFPICISRFGVPGGDRADLELGIKLLAPRTLITEVVFEPVTSKNADTKEIKLVCEGKSGNSGQMITIWRASRPNHIMAESESEMTGTFRVVGAVIIGDSVSRIQISLPVGGDSGKKQGRTKSEEKHKILVDEPVMISSKIGKKLRISKSKRISKCMDDLAILSSVSSLNPPALRRISFAPNGQPEHNPVITVKKVPAGAVWRKSKVPCFDSLSLTGPSVSPAIAVSTTTAKTNAPTVAMMLLKPINSIAPFSPPCKLQNAHENLIPSMPYSTWQEVTTKLLAGQIFHPIGKFTGDLLLATKNNSFSVSTISMLLYSSCPVLDIKSEANPTQLQLSKTIRPIGFGNNLSSPLKANPTEGGSRSIFANLFSGTASNQKQGFSADRLQYQQHKLQLPVLSPSILSLFNLFILSPNIPAGSIPPHTTTAAPTSLAGMRKQTAHPGTGESPYSKPQAHQEHRPTQQASTALAGLLAECVRLSTFTQHQSFACFTLALAAAGPVGPAVSSNNGDREVLEQAASLPVGAVVPSAVFDRVARSLCALLCVPSAAVVHPHVHAHAGGVTDGNCGVYPPAVAGKVGAAPQKGVNATTTTSTANKGIKTDQQQDARETEAEDARKWVLGLPISVRCRLLDAIDRVAADLKDIGRIAIETLGELDGWMTGLLPDVIRPVSVGKICTLMPGTVYSIMWEDGLFQGPEIWTLEYFADLTEPKGQNQDLKNKPAFASPMTPRAIGLASPARPVAKKNFQKLVSVKYLPKIESWTTAFVFLHECTSAPFLTSEVFVSDAKFRILLTKDTFWIIGLTSGKLIRFTAEIMDSHQGSKPLAVFSGSAFGHLPVAQGWKYDRTSTTTARVGDLIVGNSRQLKLTVYFSPVIGRLIETVSSNFCNHYLEQRSVPKIKRWQAFDPNYSSSRQATPISQLRLSHLSDEPLLSAGRAHEIVDIFDPEFSLSKQAFSLNTLSPPLLTAVCLSDHLTFSPDRAEDQLVEFVLTIQDASTRGAVLSAVRLNWVAPKHLRTVVLDAAAPLTSRKHVLLALHERCRRMTTPHGPSGYQDTSPYDSRPRNCYKGRAGMKKVPYKDLIAELEAIMRYLDTLPADQPNDVISAEEQRQYENLVKSEQRRLMYEDEIASLKKKLTKVMKVDTKQAKVPISSSTDRNSAQKPGFLNTLVQAIYPSDKPTQPNTTTTMNRPPSPKKAKPANLNLRDLKFDSMDSETETPQKPANKPFFERPNLPNTTQKTNAFTNVPDLKIGEKFEKLSKATVRAIDDCNLI